ncbi:MAG: hypothetical protein ACKN85_05290 [Pirellula sp.]
MNSANFKSRYAGSNILGIQFHIPTNALEIAGFLLSTIALSASLLAQPQPDISAIDASASKVKIARFLSLPPIPGVPVQQGSVEMASGALPIAGKFLPIPPLESLPPAPDGLIELANSEDPKSPKNLEQKNIIGSDSVKELRDSSSLEVLSKPLAPFDIVQKVKARDNVPQGNQDLVSQPDPRYFKHWPETSSQWTSPAFCFKPLYFEQTNLERYGLGYPCPTNALVSGTRFFADAAFLPFHALRQPPHSCQFTLGHRRPGDCNPILR